MSDILQKGKVAVITGGASGIGLAAAHKYAERGMSVVIADVVQERIDLAVAQVEAVPGAGKVLGLKVDVGVLEEVEAMKERILKELGAVHILMPNAGIGARTPAFSLSDSVETLQEGYKRVLDVNIWGVMNTCMVFAPIMVKQKDQSAIIITASRQGYLNPTTGMGSAYNMSKIAIKAYAENLAYELRQIPHCPTTAHIIVPGFVITRMTTVDYTREVPPRAVTAEETLDYVIDRVFNHGDFYVMCSDRENGPIADRPIAQWNLDDMYEHRPSASLAHPDFKDKFEAFRADWHERRTASK